MIKQIVSEHLIPIGSGAAGYEKRIELGTEVNNVLGYYVLILKNGGLIPEQCKLTFSNSAKTIFEPVGLGHLMVGQSIAIKDRFFKEEPFHVDGYVNAKLVIPSIVIGIDLIVQYVFLVQTK